MNNPAQIKHMLVATAPTANGPESFEDHPSFDARLFVGASVRFVEGSEWDEDEFEDDILTKELTSQPAWNCLAGKRGVIEQIAIDRDKGYTWIVYYVRMSCGSLIGIVSDWLEVLSPLEQLAKAVDCDD